MYSVTVPKPSFPYEVQRLAAALAPVLDQSEAHLANTLEQGSLLIGDELSQDEATFLMQQLEQIGIHAQMHQPHEQESEAEQDAASGWAMLFPDLAQGSEAISQPPSRTPEPVTPPQDEDYSLIEIDPGEGDPAHISLDDFNDEDLYNIEVVYPDEPSTSQMPSFGEEPITQPPSVPQMASSGLPKPKTFDGGDLIQAFAPDMDEPPYKPDGFDERVPHSSHMARLLSTIAPGAGQIYNGQASMAIGYGLKFFLISPWRDSMDQAQERAQKIETYWAPRPAKGNLAKAVRYAVVFQVILIGSIIGLITLGVMAWNSRTPEKAPPPLPEQVVRAVRSAKTDVLQARINGLTALDIAGAQSGSKRSKMTKEERAQRLFIRGVESCRRKDFKMCSSTMKRVLKIKPDHRLAIKLEAWSVIRSQGAKATMPDLSNVPTLSEYEMAQDGVKAPPGTKKP